MLEPYSLLLNFVLSKRVVTCSLISLLVVTNFSGEVTTIACTSTLSSTVNDWSGPCGALQDNAVRAMTPCVRADPTHCILYATLPAFFQVVSATNPRDDAIFEKHELLEQHNNHVIHRRTTAVWFSKSGIS
jgi:hypothetical protein